MKKINVRIYKEDSGYSLCAEKELPLPFGLIGEGATPQDAINEWLNIYNQYKAEYESNGEILPDLQFVFLFDVPSMLSYYAGVITCRSLAKRTGIAAATLSHYASGFRHPSPKTTAKIQSALNELGHELSTLQLV